MAVDSSFYNDNWTILNKLIYLEKFMMENDIELESLTVSVADNGDITLSGENIKGETITQTVSGADVAKASNLTALAQKALVLPDNAPATEEIVTVDTNGEQSSTSIGDGLELSNGTLTSEKAKNSLQLPNSAPASEELVTIDTNGEQSSLSVGDGLSIENGTLKASGGSGSALYRHNLHVSLSDGTPITIDLFFGLTTNSATPLTVSDITRLLMTDGRYIPMFRTDQLKSVYSAGSGTIVMESGYASYQSVSYVHDSVAAL